MFQFYFGQTIMVHLCVCLKRVTQCCGASSNVVVLYVSLTV